VRIPLRQYRDCNDAGKSGEDFLQEAGPDPDVGVSAQEVQMRFQEEALQMLKPAGMSHSHAENHCPQAISHEPNGCSVTLKGKSRIGDLELREKEPESSAKTHESSKMPTNPRAHTEPLWRAAINDAQTYSDVVAEILTMQGYTVVRFVLSWKVHNCYKLAGCANAAVQHLHCYPYALRGCLRKIRGMKTEIQLFFAYMAFAAGDFKSVEAALSHNEMMHGLNKLAMRAWLKELGVDADTMAVHSFVHLPIGMCQEVWTLVSRRFLSKSQRPSNF